MNTKFDRFLIIIISTLLALDSDQSTLCPPVFFFRMAILAIALSFRPASFPLPLHTSKIIPLERMKIPLNRETPFYPHNQLALMMFFE